ncbi:MAG: alkaline phosphatase family protein, partial [Planctomycetota bacterium]
MGRDPVNPPFAKPPPRATFLLVFLVLLGLASLGRLAMRAWLLRPVPARLPEIGATTDDVRPLCFVIIDGLHEGAAWAREDPPMPWLQAFAASGASGIAWAGDPTLTAPCVRALLTGRAPDLLTAFRNFNARPVGGTFIEYLRARGGHTAHAGDATAYQLCRPHYDREDVFSVADRGASDQGETDDVAVPFALARIAAGADVLTLHVTRPDHVGHQHGAVGPEYHRACSVVDAQVQSVVEAFLARHRDGTVLIASDHGVSATGAHGGGGPAARRAPFVLVGPGVARVADVEVSQFSLAPTVCTLLGLPLPPLADAPPARELMDLPEDVELRALDAYVEARIAVARTVDQEAVGPFERRRAAASVQRLAPGRAEGLEALARELNRVVNPSSALHITVTLLLAVVWLLTVVHVASAEARHAVRERAAAVLTVV